MTHKQQWMNRLFTKSHINILGLGTLVWSLLLNFMNYEIPIVLIGVNVLFVFGSFTYFVVKESLFFFVGKRILEALFVLWIIASVTFVTLRLVPGGPFDQDKALPPEVQANIEAKYHLNDPIWKQYGDYMFGLMQGDLGESYKYIGRGVNDIIRETVPASFQLGIFSLIVAFVIGIPAGVYAAAHHNSALDHSIMFGAVSGVSLPSFLVAPIFILLFSIYLDWLPPAFWEGPTYYLLPVITLGIRPAAVIARLTRSSVLETLGMDFARTARAKGLSERVVLFRHVLKNSLIPVLTFSGPLVAGILSGSFVIELIFAIPGMGKHLIQSVTNRDYPLILGMTLVFSAILVLSNLIVDILYSYFDPRIKLA